ncbi:MAG TPA: monofunctional biosynthetic peptidoglycan transglycosylase, partial [Desulfonatronum sp.]|nr:monofunctional biosynthetic peptidoglycan transglycosylase [Desulfonatronum sp.]
TFVIASMFLVGALRFFPPPASSFMIKRYVDGLFQQDTSSEVHYQWVDWENISPQLALAVVAAEDQKFPHHWGFDFQSIGDAIQERRTNKRLRGASTITQQTAKNLFLWDGRSFVRKGFEAWFALLMETLWSKKRILEVYLNIVEFGDGVYGVHSAATIFFDKEPSQLTRREAARMAAVLPNPKRFSVISPSGYIHQRTKEIERQMNNLGPIHLKNL